MLRQGRYLTAAILVIAVLAVHLSLEAIAVEGVSDNLSGITFNPDTGHFWVIVNQPQQLIELDQDLKRLRAITLENFTDTEAIAYGGNNTYIIADERDQSIVIAPIDQATRSLNKSQLRHLTINTRGHNNKGLEGMAVDSERQTVYAARERDPMSLITVHGMLNARPGINIQLPQGIDVDDLYMSDLSGLHFDSQTGHLLILSDESKMLAEVDLHGNKISYMDLEAGFANLTQAIPQAEGVTLDADKNLYIISEPNLIYRFKKSS